MTFNVKWPEDLLQWMRWLEFTSIDFYAVFRRRILPSSDGLPAKIRVPHGAVSYDSCNDWYCIHCHEAYQMPKRIHERVRSNADDNTYSIYGFHFVHRNMHANFSAI